MQLFKYLLTAWVIGLLTACGSGHSGNNSGVSQTENNLRLILTVTSDLCANSCNQFSTDDVLYLNAKLTNNGLPQANQIINFTSGVGELSVNSRLTNSDGEALVSLINPDNVVGATSLNASIDTLNVNYNIEFVSDTNTGNQIVNLTLLLTSDECSVNCASFTSDETIIATALVTLDGQPVTGETVDFTAPIGDLSVSGKLTDNNGIAKVLVTNPNTALGAGNITATYQTVEVSTPYEFTQADSNQPGPVDLTLVFNPDLRVEVGNTVTLSAAIKDEFNQPINNQLITFALGQGSLSTTTALTNETGVANVTFTPTETDLGAYVATASTQVAGTDYTAETIYEVQPANSSDTSSEIVLGYFDEQGQFIEGALGLQGHQANDDVTLAAGATASLVVSLAEITTVDGNSTVIPYTQAAIVSFSSSCVNANDATIDTQVSTVAGKATATYENVSCSGTSNNIDTLAASVVINSVSQTVSRDITLQPTQLGSLRFVSATPSQLVVAETGGANQSETATLTFQVLDSLSNPIAQLPVSFSLTTELGGLSTFPTESVTNSEGFVTTQVSSGTIPTSVVVEAIAELNGTSIKTQSSELTVSTGLADQDSFLIVPDVYNRETLNYLDEIVTITAYLADANESAVPDGTSVIFKAEGGALIQDRCTTIDGRCSVTWRGAEPIPDNHRITILATAIGHESYVDINSNGVYDAADGEPFDDGIGVNYLRAGNGLQDDSGSDYNDDGVIEPAFTDRNNNGQFDGPGFVDLPEAWLDINEDSKRNSNEEYNDFNGDGNFSLGNGKFNGPQCQGDETICTQAPDNRIELRASLVLIAASSNAIYTLRNADTNQILASNEFEVNPTIGALTIGLNDILNLSLSYRDTGDQILPAGTTISLNSSVGVVTNNTVIIPNSSGTSYPDLEFNGVAHFSVANNLSATNDPLIGELSISIQTPRDLVSQEAQTISFVLTLDNQ